MTYLPYIIAIIVLLFVGMQLWTWIAARRMRGQALPDVKLPDSGANNTSKRRVLYFYSPSCGPCKAIAPMMQSLSEEFPELSRIDLSKDLSLARSFSVRATPTTILAEQDTIIDVILGPPTEARLRQFLSPGG